MEAIFRKNESETNEIAAKAFLIMYGFILLIGLFGKAGIFDINPSMMVTLIIVLSVPLLLPAVLIYIFHVNMFWLKYMLIVSVSVAAGVSYYIFTFQVVILFVIPSVIASFYMNKKLLWFSAVTTCVAIVVSHAATGLYLFQPWIEPFIGMKSILQYGAVPRCMQYLLCFVFLMMINKRHLEFMEKFNMTIQEERQANRETTQADDTAKNEKEQDYAKEDEEEFRQLLLLLTEREKDVFMLMINGCTNMQIADKLCLSMGTVKNYISTIYDKIGTKERNYIILKYSRFYKDYD